MRSSGRHQNSGYNVFGPYVSANTAMSQSQSLQPEDINGSRTITPWTTTPRTTTLGTTTLGSTTPQENYPYRTTPPIGRTITPEDNYPHLRNIICFS